MVKTRVFKSGNSLAVRLPKEVALPEGTEVEVTRREDGAVVIAPFRPRTMKELVGYLRANAADLPLEILDMKPEWPLHRCPPGYREDGKEETGP